MCIRDSHCSSCRKSVGASSVSWLTVARENLIFTKGKPQIFQSSVKVLRTFCGKCGSSLTYQSEDTPATVDVTTSTISNPEDYPPTEEVWLSHQLPWDVNYERIPKYLEEMCIRDRSNPLLIFSGLPKFNEVKPEHISPAIDSLLTEGRALIESLATSAETPTWDNFALKLEDHSEKLGRAWNQVGHMNAVVNSPELREAYNENLTKLTDFGSDLSQDERLYAKYKQIQVSPDFAKLTPAQQKIINNEVRDFKLGGAELPPKEKARFKEISEQLSKLGSKFEENILDNTNDFKHLVENLADLAGIPEDAIQAAAEAAKADGKVGYQFSLHFPSYMPVLQYADNRALRETMYRAYATRASEFSKSEWDNTGLIKDILVLKKEEAKLLGFNNYAEASLTTKMADSPKQVTDFLDTLAKRAKPYAERDMQELTEYASKLGLNDMQAWDIALSLIHI